MEVKNTVYEIKYSLDGSLQRKRKVNLQQGNKNYTEAKRENDGKNIKRT